MRNHPAFKRVWLYVQKHNLTWEQIRDATAAQVWRVMYPPDGVRPPGDHATPKLVKRALRHVFVERWRAARRQEIIDRLAAAGINIDEVEILGGGWFRVHVEDDE